MRHARHACIRRFMVLMQNERILYVNISVGHKFKYEGSMVKSDSFDYRTETVVVFSEAVLSTEY